MKIQRKQRRSGAALIVVLISLLVISALVATILAATLQNQRQLHRERDRRQCELLLQAGLHKAYAKLQQDESYNGEKWQVPAEQILGTAAGEVTIELQKEQPSPTVLVVAEYPLGSAWSVRRSREITWKSSSQKVEE